MRITETIPSRLDIIPDFISSTIEKLFYLPLDEDVIFKIKLCLHEAVINAVEHGNKMDDKLSVKIVISVNKNILTMEVTDQGGGFKHGRIPNPTRPENITKPEGRGVYLIRHLMNKVKFSNGGRTITMVKILKKGRRVKVNIQVEKMGDVSVVALEGEINVSNATQLRNAFAKIVDSGEKKILADFAKVTFIDSSGLAVLIELVQNLDKVKGELRLCNVNARIMGIFEITKIHKLIDIFDSRDMGLEGLLAA